MVGDTTNDVLPWRVRPARLRPAGFVAPRERFGHRRDGARTSDSPAAVRVPFNRVQLRAARGLSESKHTAAHALAVAVADYSAIEAARAVHGDRFRNEEGFSLTFLPFVASAVAAVLPDFPSLNAFAVDDMITRKQAIHLCFAVDLDHQGLVVPVVRDADGRSVRGLARAIRDVAGRARAKQLKPDDLAGGTFTITNPGGHGTHVSFPIINRPQVAILSTDGVGKEVVADDHGRLRIAPTGRLCLGSDARAVTAAEAAGFLAALVARLERHDWIAAL